MMFLPPGVDGAAAALLIAISFLTSALTAAFGIGGGVAMLAALAGTVPPSVIIAVHGLVQLGSNLGRAFLQKDHAHWRLVGLFVLGAALGVAFGAALFRALPERALIAMLGLFILVMVWVPKPALPGLARSGMVLGGAISSALTMFVGATGPFIQSLLMPLRLDRKALVATQAVMMTAQHGLKVLAFGFIGVALVPWLPMIAAMIASGFIGTLLGTRLLERMSERVFSLALRIVLTLVALDLLRRAAGLAFPGF